MTIFEDFLNYCDEDKPELRKDIETWLCDYFDLAHRELPLSTDEITWITLNLSEDLQRKILSCTLKNYLAPKR